MCNALCETINYITVSPLCETTYNTVPFPMWDYLVIQFYSYVRPPVPKEMGKVDHFEALKTWRPTIIRESGI